MAATPEKKVKEKIKAMCKAYGAYYTMPVMTGMASNGTPDILICYKGYFAGVEAKAGRGKPTKLQLVRLKEIATAGGVALVINENNMDVLEAFFTSPLTAKTNIGLWEE